MDGHKIREALHDKGLTFGIIASALDVAKPSVSQVAHRHQTSRRIAMAIATALELPVSEVFPDHPSYANPGLHRKIRQKKVAALQRELKRKAA